MFARTTWDSAGCGLHRYWYLKGNKIAKDFQTSWTLSFPNYEVLVKFTFGNVTCSPLTMPGSLLAGTGKIHISEYINSLHRHRSVLKLVPWLGSFISVDKAPTAIAIICFNSEYLLSLKAVIKHWNWWLFQNFFHAVVLLFPASYSGDNTWLSHQKSS